MRLKNRILTILIAVMLIPVFASAAPKMSVKAKLDSTVILMGKIARLEVTIDQPHGVKGHFPLFANVLEKGYVSVCKDSVELRAPLKPDTTVNGAMERIVFTIPVQTFDSGFYQLPELDYVSGLDTARSNAVSLKVLPVIVQANEPIDDYANVAKPENSSILDSLPDWLYYYWWAVLIGLGLIGGLIWLYRRYKREGSLLPKKPEPTPYEMAMRNLVELKGKKLWQQGQEKEYFTELTDILREYMYKRFGINALEMTSREIMQALKENAETKDKRAYMRQILSLSDFAKFAKVRPLPEDSEAAYDNAVKFVRETKPVDPDPNEKPAKGAATVASAQSKTSKRKFRIGKKGGKR